VISDVVTTPDVLGPPNHEMIDVTLAYQAVDFGADGHTIVTAAPSCNLSVTSDEPANGTGDGNTASDWAVIDAHHVQLRDERAGTGNGRVYTITIRCTDAAGNQSTATTTAHVPK
jgi:type V secretory pathway adhesin AidA